MDAGGGEHDLADLEQKCCPAHLGFPGDEEGVPMPFAA